MAFPLDLAAQNATLDSLLGDNAGASMPTSFEVALFTGDPNTSGTELLSAGGYARAVVANASSVFPDADAGQKVSETIEFGLPSDAWAGATSNQITHWQLISAADSTTRYFSRAFSTPFSIAGDETFVGVELVLAWNVEGA